MGALLIAAVSATALISASSQALTWSVVPSPSLTPGKDANSLVAVSCVSTTHCMATGYYYGKSRHGTPESALAETWNGTTWSVVPTPKPTLRALYGVSCPSATACIAVGASELSLNFTQIQLAEFWNGTTWSVMPNLANIGSELLGVSCVSPTDCTAVGDQSDFSNGRSLTFIESWNGTTWSTVPSPNTKSGDDFLSSVSCISATNCTAAGVRYPAKLSGSSPLIESWNGKSWSIEPAPNEAGNGDLNGVSCVSARSCVAVGTYLAKTPVVNKALIEKWNGTRWSIAALPQQQSELNGVSCVSAADCWAAGLQWKSVTANASTFMERWNGTSWSVEPTPNVRTAATYNIFGGVSCASAGFCEAVGWHGPRTLVEAGTTAR
jgi:hypothetical protein